jgi:methionyl-tRNA formyltransferase
VSLHFVTELVDGGDIIAQMPISYGWEDTGGTLYEKATVYMVALFKETYPMLRVMRVNRVRQNLTEGSYHRAVELDEASRITLEKEYKARELLNLLRARTFPGRPSCWFRDDGVTYEVRVEIVRKQA